MKKAETSGTITAHPGAILKAIRLERGLTLSEVNKLTGLPISTLSKVENEKLALSYDKLTRISSGLKVDISHFFGSVESVRSEPQPGMVVTHGRRSISRSGQGSVIETDNYVHLYPAADLLRKQIIPIVGEIKTRSIEEFGDFIRHEGEEFAYVVEGAIEFHTELYTPVLLEKGDSVYFDSSMGHAYIAALDTPCVVLSACIGELSKR